MARPLGTRAVSVASTGPPGPRVLLVVNADWYFLSHRLSLARALRDAGATVLVATGAERGPASDITREGFEYHELALNRRSLAPWRELRTLAMLAGLYRRLQPDLVHHLTIKPVIYGSLAARLAGVTRVVNTIPGLGYMFTGQGGVGRLRASAALRLYQAAFVATPGRVIFQNADDMRLLTSRGAVRKDLAVVIRGSGVDLDQFSPVDEPPGTPVVMLAARLLWDKGVGEFVEAARLLRERRVACRMVLVGAPDPSNPRQVPQTQVEDWARDGIVEWWGQREDMAAVLAQATLVALPSYREGLPRVLIEAAATARAIVGADAAGTRDVVRHGINGLLVPVRDARALAGAIGELLDNPARRQQMGAAGRRIAVDEFSTDTVNRQTLALYRELLGARWPAGARGAA